MRGGDIIAGPVLEQSRCWDAYFAVAGLALASGPGGRSIVGERWFAVLSGEASGELNVCALTPGAGERSAHELLRVLGDDLPTVVFRSDAADPATTPLLAGAGFATAAVSEALMACLRPPQPRPSGFRIARALDQAELEHALALASDAHQIERPLLERSIGQAPPAAVDLWIAWDGAEPISVVWLVRHGPALGVMSMMTPRRHQRRGAGSALLATALAETWTDAVEFAVLVSTPAGRRLYESLGFTTVDEVTTSFRGADEALLEAIGQPAGG